jgi:hypothetical protein
MTDKAKSPKDLQNEAANESLTQLVKGITNRRWLAIRVALGMTIAEIQGEQELLLIAAANEHHRALHGNDSWEKFLDMTETETMAFLGFDVNDTSEDAPKSDAPAAPVG